MTTEVFLLSAQRTPIGSFMGSLSEVAAPQLGATAARAALASAGVSPEQVEAVYFGNVLSAGVGQAPARQAALAAGVPNSVPTATVNKVCGSGLEAILLGSRAIKTGEASVVLAGGMENMSRAPHYLLGSRGGLRMGDGKLVDGMIHDGLWDPYQNYHMGQAGELCAKEYALTREAQDAFATESYRRASAAIQSGAFAAEIAAVSIAQKKGDPVVVSADEEPGRGNPAKFAALRPAFAADGTITAANASSINDGAAAVVLASAAAAKHLESKPLARIVATGYGAQAPEWFTTAPVKAVQQALSRAGLTAKDIDLWEINEAFSCVAMSCAQLIGVDLERVNVNGGAVALGHPIGASGARVLTTLVHALRARGQKRGLATLCIGGGEGIAAIIELC